MNYAELQQRVDRGELTEAECYRRGQTHAAYGWSKSPGFKPTPAQLAAYEAGHDDYRENQHEG